MIGGVMDPLALFLERVGQMQASSVLELGTKRSKPKRSTMHRSWVPQASEFLGTDFQEGLDVDIVADVHQLGSSVGGRQFDVVISCSTFEHIQYPWIAAEEIAKVLKPGGLIYVQTHHSFPIHAYPYDYWRFTREGLETLFAERFGFKTLASAYQHRSFIANFHIPWLARHPSYLNVSLVAERL